MTKIYDKPLTRKHCLKFNPRQATDLIRQGPMPENLDEDARRGLIQAYIDVRQDKIDRRECMAVDYDTTCVYKVLDCRLLVIHIYH